MPKKSGGFRPVIDLKRLNQFIQCPTFRMESDRSIRQQLQAGEWTTSIDFSDAYLHIPVDPVYRKYLRLYIQGQSFQFRAMCFGLNIAPRVFTKLLDPVAAHLRSRGILLHRYLDDWLFRGQSPREVSAATTQALDLFSSLGLVVNFQKSDLVPRTSFVFLGMDVDLVRAWVRPTSDEVHKILDLVDRLLRLRTAPVRLLLSFLGLLNHAAQFIHLGRLHIRPIQFYVKVWAPNLHEMIDRLIPLEDSFRRALHFWQDSSRLRQGVPLHLPAPSLTLTTDASLQGWGTFLEGHQARGRWSPQESAQHISLLELRAVRLALLSLERVVRGQAVKLLADNTTAVAYIRNQGGTHSVSLYREARLLLLWCSQHQVTLLPFYMPGHLNSLADLLSRESQVLGTEWTLHSAIFRQLHRLVPALSVDLFSTRLNNQLPRFVSPCPDPLAWRTDAFSFEWEDMVAYAFPPTKLLGEVLRKLHRSHIQLFLVAPLWPNQAWFQDLLRLLFDLPLRLPLWHHLLRQPHVPVYHQDPSLLALHVWPLSGRISDRRAFLGRLRSTPQPTSASLLFGCMNLTGEPSVVGAQSGISIPALPLFPR